MGTGSGEDEPLVLRLPPRRTSDEDEEEDAHMFSLLRNAGNRSRTTSSSSDSDSDSSKRPSLVDYGADEEDSDGETGKDEVPDAQQAMKRPRVV